MVETIDIRKVAEALKKRLWLIILITVIITGVTAVVTYFFLTPVYEAKTEIIVNQSRDDKQMYSTSEIQSNLQLVSTYTGIIKSPVVLDKVKNNLGLDSDLINLKDQINVGNEQNSQIITIVVQNPDPILAVNIANEVAQVFQSEVVNIMNIDNVKILAEAEAKRPLSPVKPNPVINIVMAFALGLFIGSTVVFVIEYMDNTIKTESDIEKLLDQSVLGVVSTHIHTDLKEHRHQAGKSHNKVRGESIGS